MSFWTAIVCIVAIGAVASLLRSRINARAGITEDHLGNQSLARPHDAEIEAREQAAQEEIAQLKDRIAVLERIATDANSTGARASAQIATEIEALRSPDAGSQPTQPSNHD